MKQELNLDEWLDSTREKLDQLYAYAKSALPAEPLGRPQGIEKAIECADDAGRLLADAESFLVQFKAQAVLAMREKYPDMTAKEREKMEKAEVRTVQRLVDGIAVTVKTINSRIFSQMNANRSRL